MESNQICHAKYNIGLKSNTHNSFKKRSTLFFSREIKLETVVKLFLIKFSLAICLPSGERGYTFPQYCINSR